MASGARLRPPQKVAGSAPSTTRREKDGLGPRDRVKVSLPRNIYSRGFRANLWEVCHPVSSRHADGFAEARAVGGVALGFPPRPPAEETEEGEEGEEEEGEEERVDDRARQAEPTHAKAE